MADRSALSLLERPLSFESLALPVDGGAILCLGLGGGSDAVTACLLARILERAGAREVHYGNTRGRFDEHVTRLSEHLGRIQGPRQALLRPPRHGTTEIDRSLPRGPGGSPLVVLLEKASLQEAPAQIVSELDGLGYRLIVGVDTGGDVLKRRKQGSNRDRVMLRALQATQAEVLGVAVGLGSDGTPLDQVTEPLLHLGPDYLGCFSLAPWVPLLQELSAGLGDRRTPRLILQALASSEAGLTIPRGANPHVPRELLGHAFVFRARAL
jgi:hypothetical protein